MSYFNNALLNAPAQSTAAFAQANQGAAPTPLPVTKFVDGRTLAAKPVDFGSVFNAAAANINKEADRDLKRADQELKQKQLDLAQARFDYEKDPESFANQYKKAQIEYQKSVSRLKEIETGLAVSKHNMMADLFGGNKMAMPGTGGAAAGGNALTAPGVSTAPVPQGVGISQLPPEDGGPTTTTAPSAPATGQTGTPGTPSSPNVKKAVKGGVQGQDKLRQIMMLEYFGLDKGAKFVADSHIEEIKKQNEFQKAYDKAMGTEIAAEQKKLSEEYARAQSQKRHLMVMKDLNEQNITGYFSEYQMMLGQMAKHFGLQDQFEEALGAPGATKKLEVMNALRGKMAMGLIGQQGTTEGGMPAANMSDRDMQLMLNSQPNLKNTREGNRFLIAAGEHAIKMQELKVEEYLKWRDDNPQAPIIHFQHKWKKIRNDPKYGLSKTFRDNLERFAGKRAKPGPGSERKPTGRKAAQDAKNNKIQTGYEDASDDEIRKQLGLE